ncbi:hypothetical protein GXM_01227 [Nostoc sphaeroides CCNUC1]|uniref:Uncharacterized protein n=1 Tax=Nostoc sphaeroides CCNUC1 TaxID=2653204 RepID=A0A5P8VTT3_9NOSO|nr:hypothetical protein GXM_01227 [Nostoc sphaeroides CCNUC1]
MRSAKAWIERLFDSVICWSSENSINTKTVEQQIFILSTAFH